MNYGEWLLAVPANVKKDSLWELDLYRKALFLHDLAWNDCERMLAHELGRPVAWQLIRSAGSISANIEEGYGRGFGRDYARFLRIALGSARETKGWYYRGKRLLSADITAQRIELLESIIAGLVLMSRHQSSLKP